MKKLTALTLALVLLAALLTGCGSGNSSDRLAGIQSAGKIVVALDPNFPPFEYGGEGTEIVGVDVDLANAIAKELGVTVEFVTADFDGIISSLAAGKADIAISGITINEDRKESVDFSDAYIRSVQYLLLPKDSTIAVMEDLAGKRVGSPLGYTGQFVMDDAVAGPDPDEGTEAGVLYEKDCEIKTYRSAIEGTLDMKNGRLDAVIIDEFVAKKISSEDDSIKAIELKYADGSNASEEYGVAVRKEGNAALLEKINSVVARLKGDGTIESWVISHSS